MVFCCWSWPPVFLIWTENSNSLLLRWSHFIILSAWSDLCWNKNYRSIYLIDCCPNPLNGLLLCGPKSHLHDSSFMCGREPVLCTNLSWTISSSNLYAAAANYFLYHYKQTCEPVSLTSLHGFLYDRHGDQRGKELEIDSHGGDEEWQINVKLHVRGSWILNTAPVIELAYSLKKINVVWRTTISLVLQGCWYHTVETLLVYTSAILALY